MGSGHRAFTPSPPRGVGTEAGRVWMDHGAGKLALLGLGDGVPGAGC